MNPHQRVVQLIALATNAGASSEEARTAAIAAVKLIAEHKMLGGPSGTQQARGIPPNGAGFPVIFDQLFEKLGQVAVNASTVEMLRMRGAISRLEDQKAALASENAELRRKLREKESPFHVPPPIVDPSRKRRRKAATR